MFKSKILLLLFLTFATVSAGSEQFFDRNKGLWKKGISGDYAPVSQVFDHLPGTSNVNKALSPQLNKNPPMYSLVGKEAAQYLNPDFYANFFGSEADHEDHSIGEDLAANKVNLTEKVGAKAAEVPAKLNKVPIANTIRTPVAVNSDHAIKSEQFFGRNGDLWKKKINHASENISNGVGRLRFLFRNDLSGYEDPVVLDGNTDKKHKENFANKIQFDKFECMRGNNLKIVAKYAGVVDFKHLFFTKLRQARSLKSKNYNVNDIVPFGVFEIEVSKEDQSSWTSVGVECSAKFAGFTVRIKEPFKPLHIIGDFVNCFVLTGKERENEYEVNAEMSDTDGKIVEAIQLSQPAFNVLTPKYLFGINQPLSYSRMKDYEGFRMIYNSRSAIPRRKLVIRNEKKKIYNAFISTIGITEFVKVGLAGDEAQGTMTVNPIVDAFCFESPQKAKETDQRKSVVFNVEVKKEYYDEKYDILVPNSLEELSCVVLLQNEVCYLYENIFLHKSNAAESAPQDLETIDHTIVGRILEKEGFNCKEYVIWIGEIQMEKSSITHALEQLKKLTEIGINKKDGHTNNAPNHTVIGFTHNGITASNVNKEVKAKVQEQVGSENVSHESDDKLRFHFRNDLSGHEDPIVLVGGTIKIFNCISRNNHLNAVARYVGVVDVKHDLFWKIRNLRSESKKEYKAYEGKAPFGVFVIEASEKDRSSWTTVGVECTAEYKNGGYTVRIKEPFKPLHINGTFVNHFVLTGKERENEYNVDNKISKANDKIFEAILLSQPAFNVYPHEFLYGRKPEKFNRNFINDFEGLGMTFNSRSAFPRMNILFRSEKNEKSSYNAFISTYGITKRLDWTMTLNPIVDGFCFESPLKAKVTGRKSVVFNMDIEKKFNYYEQGYKILIENSTEHMSCVVLLQNEVCYLYENTPQNSIDAIDHTIVREILEMEGFNCKEYVIWIGKNEKKRSSITHVLEQLKKSPETEIKKKEDHANNAPNRPVLDSPHSGIFASNVNKEAKEKVREQVGKVSPKEEIITHKTVDGYTQITTKDGQKRWVPKKP